MLGQKAAIALVSFALIFSVNKAEKFNMPAECAQFGEICNLHRHCCGNLKCDQSDTLGRFECKEKTMLGGSCKYTADCFDILHSVCTNKKCTCRQSTIKVNDYACQPLLDEFCWKNETCATEHSMCIDNKCQCIYKFSAEFNKCLPDVIGLPCNDDAACESVRFAKCLPRKVCFCSNNTIATSKRKCSVALGEACESHQDCGVADSWCYDDKCQCRSQYIAHSNIECKLPYLGMPCMKSADCNAHIVHSICLNKTCTCRDDHTLWDGNICLPTTNKYCTELKDCVEMNGDCISGRCRCGDNYVLRESICRPKQLTGRCRTTSDCSEIKFAVCSEGECQCVNARLTVDATTCTRALGGHCTVNEECTIKFSKCYHNECKCNYGYTQHLDSQCIAMEQGITCSNDNTCNLIKNAHCFEGQCRCKDNYVEFNPLTCIGLLNATCVDNLECDHENSECIDNKCQCEFSYFPKSKYECILMYLEQRCSIDEDCIGILHAKCSVAGKCICHENYLRIGPKTCAATLEGYCTNDKECATVNAVCFRNQCRCSAGFMKRSDNLCSPGQICDKVEDCDKIANAECFDKKCKCRPGYTKFDRQVCLPLTGEHCREHKECAVYNSNCVDNKCQCLETFTPMTQSECVPTGINGLCYTDDDCEIVNSRCSRFQYCTCNQNYISINGKCAAIFGAYCLESTTCTPLNSECINNTCQCSRHYELGPYNECLPLLLGGSCSTDLSCKNIQNAICIDNVCVCKPNSFALTPSFCTQLINTHCSSSADCDIEASHCIDNKCQCRDNWQAVADTMCVRRSALYNCDNTIECGVPWRSKCFQNYCVCNPNHIALNALTCLPILDGICWRDDQCKTEHSYCSDYRCQCKPSFVAVASNLCVAL